MIPRIGTAPDPSIKYTLRPGAYAILPRGDQVLLTVQMETPPDIQLPGGGIDPGEAPVPALHREVMEETGWTIAAPRRLGAFRRFVYMPEYDLWAEKLCTIYVARPVLQVSDPLEPDHEVLWLPQSEAVLQLGNAGDRRMMQQYLDRST